MPYALQLILSTPTPTFPIYGLRLLFFPLPELFLTLPAKAPSFQAALPAEQALRQPISAFHSNGHGSLFAAL